MNDVSQKQIAIIGECMIELSGEPFSTQEQRFGGDTLNTALYLSRLSSSAQVHYVTALGHDNYSALMRQAWEREGIDCRYVLHSNKMPALYAIELSPSGERAFHYWRNDSAARYLCQHPQFDSVMNSLTQCDLIYLSGISLAILPEQDKQVLLDALSIAKQSGVQIAVDSNYRPRLWNDASHAQHWTHALYDLADIALVTGDDEELLHGETLSADTIIERLHQRGVGTVVVKLGSDGAMWSKAGERGLAQGKLVERVVDTTAAGDSFNAGFLAAWSQQHSVAECCLWGNTLAAQVIQHKGAIIPQSATQPIFELLSK